MLAQDGQVVAVEKRVLGDGLGRQGRPFPFWRDLTESILLTNASGRRNKPTGKGLESPLQAAGVSRIHYGQRVARVGPLRVVALIRP